MFNVYAMLHLLGFFIAIFLANYVYYQDTKERVNILFSLLSLFEGFVLFVEFELSSLISSDGISFWTKLHYLWIFTMALQLHFALVFTGSKIAFDRKFLIVNYILPIVIWIMMLITGLGKSTKVTWGWIYGSPVEEWVNIVFIGYVLLTSTILNVTLFRFYIQAKNDKLRNQTKYLLVGVLIPTITGIIMQIFIELGRPLQISTLNYLLGVIFIAIAVFKYNLFQKDSQKIKFAELMHHSQKMDALGHLAGSIAHDFNNMLSVIIGYQELILLQIDENNPIYNDLLEINKVTDKASVITRQLLTLSTKQVVNREVLNLNEIILGISNILKKFIKNGVIFRMELNPELNNVNVDRHHVEQIILNLVLNANDAIEFEGTVLVKTYNIENKEKLESKFMQIPKGEFIALEVTDTGQGIASNLISKIFEPFFTTKKAKRGTGLGLSIVDGLVKSNKGYIDISSKIDMGTTFTIFFPLCKLLIVKPSVFHKTKSNNDLIGKIIIVEDEDKLR